VGIVFFVANTPVKILWPRYRKNMGGHLVAIME
jgi:hypothetical protein